MVKTNFGKKGKKENKKNGLTQLGQPYRTGPTQRENQPARPNRLSLSLLSLISGTHQSAGPTRQRRPLPLDVLDPDSSQTLTLTGSGSILVVRAPRRPHHAPINTPDTCPLSPQIAASLAPPIHGNCSPDLTTPPPPPVTSPGCPSPPLAAPPPPSTPPRRAATRHGLRHLQTPRNADNLDARATAVVATISGVHPGEPPFPFFVR
jgi:hypothetical protein